MLHYIVAHNTHLSDHGEIKNMADAHWTDQDTSSIFVRCPNVRHESTKKTRKTRLKWCTGCGRCRTDMCVSCIRFLNNEPACVAEETRKIKCSNEEG